MSKLSTAADDLALMRRIGAHDAAAFGELYDRHGRLVCGLLCRMLGEQAEAEQVLEDVFRAVWETGPAFSPDRHSPLAWIIRLARERALARLSAAGQIPREPLQQSHSAVAVTAAPDADAAHIMKALAALPAEQRCLIEAAYFRGLSRAELGQQYHLPVDLVDNRIRTGLLALRRQLAEPLTSL